jgi:hypothetical protein
MVTAPAAEAARKLRRLADGDFADIVLLLPWCSLLF